jgi:hypothetical protein
MAEGAIDIYCQLPRHNQSQTTRLPSGPTAWYSTAAYEASRSTLCRAAAATAGPSAANAGDVGAFWGDAKAAALAAAAVLCTLFGSCDWWTEAEVTSERGANVSALPPQTTQL